MIYFYQFKRLIGRQQKIIFSRISFQIIKLEPIKSFARCHFQILFKFITVWGLLVRYGIIRTVSNIRTHDNRKKS